MFPSTINSLYSPVSTYKTRLGFRTTDPIDPMVNLSHQDVVDQFKPTQSLVNEISKRLTRDNGNLGFVIIPNPKTVLKNNDNTLKFLQNLMREVSKDWSNKGLLNNINKWLLATKVTNDGATQEHKNGSSDEKGQFWTQKSPHFDQFPFLVAHYYGDSVNVSGGKSRLYDVNEWAKDNNQPSIYSALSSGALKQTKNAKSNYVELTNEQLSPYLYEVPEDLTDYIVIFNNDKQAGIAHGASEVTLKSPDLEHIRYYIRVSLTQQRENEPIYSQTKHLKRLDKTKKVQLESLSL